MAQPFQSLNPGSASRAIADEDAVESLVLIPLLQPGFDGLWCQYMPFAHQAELKIGQHKTTFAAARIENGHPLHGDVSIVTTTGSALSLTPEAITFMTVLLLGPAISVWAS